MNALPNPFCFTGVTFPSPVEAAAPHAPLASGAAATSFLSGDIDENLQRLQPAPPMRSVSPEKDRDFGRPRSSLQNMHKETAPREMEIWKASQQPQSAEKSSARAPSKGCAERENNEAEPLSALRCDDGSKVFGCPPSGLQQASGSSLAMPPVSWNGASLVETGCLAPAATNSVSPGVVATPHNSGERDPAVMLDYAPGESYSRQHQQLRALYDELDPPEPPLFLQRPTYDAPFPVNAFLEVFMRERR